MTDHPKTVWAEAPDLFDDMGIWHNKQLKGTVEYLRQDIVNETLTKLVDEIEQLRTALTDAVNALAKFIDTERKLREPYETPLSAYDRGVEVLKSKQMTKSAPGADGSA